MSPHSTLFQPASSILVVGAGVLGLSTATLLQSRYPNIPLAILAAELPTPSPMKKFFQPNTNDQVQASASADYASMWAGAHYRPIPRSTRQLSEEAGLCLRTAKTMKAIAQNSPDAGVEIVPAAEYLEQTPPDANLALKTGDIYAGDNDEFRVLSKSEEVPDEHIKWGCEYRAYVVNVHVYCQWLLDNFKKNGGDVVQKRLGSLEDAFEQQHQHQAPLVVNCSGRNFDTDPKMQIIRGQTVLVKNQYHKTVTRQNADGSWAFLIPRPLGGGTIVGGTKEIGDTETKPREESRRMLLEQAVKYYPDFVSKVEDFEVVMDNVGRRPWREGGLRIEIEDLGQDRIVVHGYGAGGRGYELSWGAAEEIVALVEQCLDGEQEKQ